MADYVTNLITTRDEIAERLAAISANPKPNYSLDGESYSWADYFDMLSRNLKLIEEAIQRAGTPFEIRSRRYT
jgi:hypothetical protein